MAKRRSATPLEEEIMLEMMLEDLDITEKKRPNPRVNYLKGNDKERFNCFKLQSFQSVKG